MRILFLHPLGWGGEYAILAEFQRRGYEVCVLEERREGMSGKRLLAEYFREPGDGIRTLWYHPGRGAERVLTLPIDRYFRKTFDGRNLAHRMWVIREAARRYGILRNDDARIAAGRDAAVVRRGGRGAS